MEGHQGTAKADHAQRHHQKAHADNIGPVSVFNAGVDHRRHHQRHQELKGSLQQLEGRRKHTFLSIPFHITKQLFHTDLPRFSGLLFLASRCEFNRSARGCLKTEKMPDFVQGEMVSRRRTTRRADARLRFPTQKSVRIGQKDGVYDFSNNLYFIVAIFSFCRNCFSWHFQAFPGKTKEKNSRHCFSPL